MKLAIFSDIHGNLRNLELFLADVQARGVDRLVCLGDLVTFGPCSHQVIEKLRELRCDIVRGNHDRFMLEPGTVRSYTTSDYVLKSIATARLQMTTGDLDFLARLPRTLAIDAEKRILCCHGLPDDDTHGISEGTSDENLRKVAAQDPAEIFCCGHTHVACVRESEGKTFVNAGSVGMAFKEVYTGAEPVILPHIDYAVVTVTRASVLVTPVRLTA